MNMILSKYFGVYIITSIIYINSLFINITVTITIIMTIAKHYYDYYLLLLLLCVYIMIMFMLIMCIINYCSYYYYYYYYYHSYDCFSLPSFRGEGVRNGMAIGSEGAAGARRCIYIYIYT